MLGISKTLFRTLYKQFPVYTYKDIFYTPPQSDTDMIQRYLPSKLWRLNNLYSIINKQGKKIPFVMNTAQHKVYQIHLKHPRLIILKSRQQGISTLWLVSFFDDCIFNDTFSSGLMAQGESEASTLLLRVKLLWDEFPQSLKDFLSLKLITDNTRAFALSNKSSIVIRTSFRASTLQRLHISEFGKIANTYPERAQETLTGSLEAISFENTLIIESTASGENLYKQLWDESLSQYQNLTKDDFYPVFLSWLDDPDCNIQEDQVFTSEQLQYFDSLQKLFAITLTRTQKNFWATKNRRLHDLIYQEYPTTAEEAFLKNRDGAYYAHFYISLIKRNNREIPNLFQEALPVQVAVDLGRNDLFVLIFFQTDTEGWKIINDYKNTGQSIQHYCEIMDSYSKQFGYDITSVVLPHDAVVKELTSDISREQAFWKYGYSSTTVVPKTSHIDNDRELVRQAMHTMFVDPQARYIIDCFLNYSKEWDSRHNIWKNTHEHNIYSHGADALRQMVRGGKPYTLTRSQKIQYIYPYIQRSKDYPKTLSL